MAFISSRALRSYGHVSVQTTEVPEGIEQWPASAGGAHGDIYDHQYRMENSMNNKIYKMSFSKLYSLLIEKAEKKGRTRDEMDEITCWLTGYSKEQIDEFLIKDIEYGEFFLNAPQLNENRKKITGKICGIRVEEIEEPLMQEIRYLDKLVDELAKGKSLDKILRK